MDNVNIEAAVVQWLASTFDNWQVCGDKPRVTDKSENIEKFILVDRTGGAREAMALDMAEILIEVYHKSSRLDASEMANEIADKITDLLNIENITRVNVNSVVRLDDLIAQYYRYQVYIDVHNRRNF